MSDFLILQASNPPILELYQGLKGDKGDTGEQGIQGEKGDKGDTGEQGLKGDKGDTGEQGIQGEKGDKALNWKGAYNALTAYIIDDGVSYNGSSYICKLASTGNLPINTTFWDLLAAKGIDGLGSGDMSKSTYDINNNGVVDDSEKLNGQPASFYAAETTTTTGSLINSATAKTTLADNDMFGIMDSAASNVLKKFSFANLKSWLSSFIYPIGSIYTSVVNTNPSTLFGGTWTAFGAGRCLVGVDTGQIEFDTVEETGGAKTHTLTEAEIPAHTHTVRKRTFNAASSALGFAEGAEIANRDFSTGSTGGGGAHNNLQPYITVYFWKRTA